MIKEQQLYIKTKNGVWKIKNSDFGYKYFECNIEGVSCTVAEGSTYWNDNKENISSDIIELGDVLVVAEPNTKPRILDLEVLRNEEFVQQCIKDIRENKTHYYISCWDSRSNLNKFAELTPKGIMYLWD